MRAGFECGLKRGQSIFRGARGEAPVSRDEGAVSSAGEKPNGHLFPLKAGKAVPRPAARYSCFKKCSTNRRDANLKDEWSDQSVWWLKPILLNQGRHSRMP